MHLNATLLIEVISFLLLVGILTKLLYKPVLSVLDKRSKNVEDLLRESRHSKREAEERLKEAQSVLDKAKEEIIEMKERSRLEADQTRKAILDDAKKEAQRFLDSSKQELEKEEELVRRSIRNQIADYSIAIAEKILRREIRKEDHDALIRKTLEEIEQREG